jgi:hypothetical protein
VSICPPRLERQLDAYQVAINNRREIIADGRYTAGVKASLYYAFHTLAHTIGSWPRRIYALAKIFEF